MFIAAGPGEAHDAASHSPMKSLTDPTPPPGHELEDIVRRLGRDLGDSLGRAVESLPGARPGPKKLATLLGTTVVNTSRLLKAIGSSDPIAVLTHLPGPEPLRRLLAAARAKGADRSALADARDAVERFDELIEREGDRGAFDAVLATWLPEERKKFEARRRQSAFKALSELKGCSCDLDTSTLLVHPARDAGRVDLVLLQGMYGLRRLRPGVRVKFGARRLAPGAEARRPTDLDGRPASNGLASVRLDEFCLAPPGPLEAHVFGDDVLYTLGETGFGPRSTVDLVLGEVNRSELSAVPEPGRRRFFFHLVSIPARRAVFDLFLHRSLASLGEPELVVVDTSCEGPANLNDRVRDFDRMVVRESIERLGFGPDALRGAGIPRYGELVGHACAKLGWDLEEHAGYRVSLEHPLVGMQLCMAFGADSPAARPR